MSDDWESRYRGMDYRDASREGSRLIAQAHASGNWHGIVDRLAALRDVMQRQVDPIRGMPSPMIEA